MQNKNDTIINGNIAKGILLFSLPLCLSNVLQVLFNVSDVAIVGKYAGASALGSVGSCSILVSLFTTFIIGSSSGMSIIIARYKGANDHEKMVRSITSSFYLSVLFGIVLLVLGVGLAEVFLQLIGTKEDLLDGALVYLRIYFLALPGCMMYNFGAGVFQAVGDTKKPLYILMASGLINVGLNLLFVIRFNMSTAGVALASCISQYISAVCVLFLLLRSKEEHRLQTDKKLFNKTLAKQIAALAVPSGFQSAVFAIANLFIQAAVNTFPTIVVEGNSAATNADSIIYDVMAAFYTACASYMSQNYGAGKKERILKSYLISLAYSFGIGMAMGLTLYAFGEEFLGLFADEEEVITAGMERLKVMSISYGFSAFMDCTISASRGLGKSTVPTVIVILGSCVFRIIWVYTVFAAYRTITSIYMLYICSWTLTAAFEIAYFIPLYRYRIQEIDRV